MQKLFLLFDYIEKIKKILKKDLNRSERFEIINLFRKYFIYEDLKFQTEQLDRQLDSEWKKYFEHEREHSLMDYFEESDEINKINKDMVYYLFNGFLDLERHTILELHDLLKEYTDQVKKIKYSFAEKEKYFWMSDELNKITGFLLDQIQNKHSLYYNIEVTNNSVTNLKLEIQSSSSKITSRIYIRERYEENIERTMTYNLIDSSDNLQGLFKEIIKILNNYKLIDDLIVHIAEELLA